MLICSLEQGGLAAKLSQPSVYLPTKPGPKLWGPLEITDFSVDGWELQRFAVSPRPCSWQEESGQLVSQRLGVLEVMSFPRELVGAASYLLLSGTCWWCSWEKQLRPVTFVLFPAVSPVLEYAWCVAVG